MTDIRATIVAAALAEHVLYTVGFANFACAAPDCSWAPVPEGDPVDMEFAAHQAAAVLAALDADPRVVTEVERACEVMHDAYERAAVGAGWETQTASRKPWADVPEANKATMRAAVGALLNHIARR